jgi:hypothetical protein
LSLARTNSSDSSSRDELNDSKKTVNNKKKPALSSTAQLQGFGIKVSSGIVQT